jgi:hypothetical protein
VKPCAKFNHLISNILLFLLILLQLLSYAQQYSTNTQSLSFSRKKERKSNPNLQTAPCGQADQIQHHIQPRSSQQMRIQINWTFTSMSSRPITKTQPTKVVSARTYSQLAISSPFPFLHELTRHMITPIHLTNPHATRRTSLTRPLNHLFRLPILSSPHLRTLRCSASRINPLFVLSTRFVFVPVHVVADAEAVGAGGADEEDAVVVFLAG